MLSSEAGLENITMTNFGANAAALLCEMFQLLGGERLSKIELHLRSKLIQNPENPYSYLTSDI